MTADHFDFLLAPDGPVALTIRESLLPVLGKDAPIFPPTFAAPEGDKEKLPSYVIDGAGPDSIALIDTVGAQANRIEPLFERQAYRNLVPQIEITIGERKVNLLQAGHRAADAVVRFCDESSKFQKAFLAYRDSGDATPLAKLAPTSIIFGVWDSRDTQVKLPRLVESAIRAYNVKSLTRSAQFFSELEKSDTADLGLNQKELSEEGLDDAPSGRGVGGVLVAGEIRRDVTLNLISLRALSASDAETTKILQRYILGLALIAFSGPAELFLRQGCLLTADPEKPTEVTQVKRTGQRQPFAASLPDLEAYADLAAKDFGVGDALNANFDSDKVKAARAAKEEKKKKQKQQKEPQPKG